MDTYMHVYVYDCMYVSMNACIHVHKYVYGFMYICMHLCAYLF